MMMQSLPLLLTLALTAAPGDQDLDRGRALLRDKDGQGAARALTACLQKAPDRVDCHWELGWAHYLNRDWQKVVEHWRAVQRLDPAHPEVGAHLPQAEQQLAFMREVDKSAAGAPATVAQPAPDGATLRIRAAGDVMIGTDFPDGYLPKDPAGVMAAVAPVLKDADLTFVNLEGPLCDSGETKKCKPGQNCYAFRSPTKYVEHLVTAGVDLASTANNHSGDFGDECRTETEQTLDKAGIAWSGRLGTVAHVEKNGLKIAMIGFHTGDGVNYVNDHETAQKLVAREAKSNHIVIVSFHGGAEGSKALHVPDEMEIFYGEKRGHLRKFARAVIDAGADLVLGHGPHVARGMEVYNDRLIAYSLGNFATYGRFTLKGALGQGMVLETNLDKDGRFVGGKIIATKQVGKGIAVPDPDGGVIKLVHKLTRADFPKTGVVIGQDGTLGRP